MKVKTKSRIGYALTFVLLIQFNAPTFIIAATGIGMMMPSKSYATEPESDTELLDSLNTKFNLNDPFRNHQNTDTALTAPVSTSKDISSLIQDGINAGALSKPLGPLVSASETDLSDPSAVSQSFRRESLAIGFTHNAPTSNASGELNIRYAKKSTRKFEYDENGKLVIKILDEPAEYVEGISKENYLSSEVNRSDVTFNADSAAGDNDMIINEGKNARRSLSTGSDSTSRAYQTVTQFADQANNTQVSSSAGFLNASRIAFDDAKTPAGGFFGACTSTTETIVDTIEYPAYVEKTCQKITAQNLNFCEVERKLRVPFVVTGSGFTSCGLGCYRLFFGEEGDNYWRPTGGGSDIFSVGRAISMNLSDGMALSSVTAGGNVDDHLELEIGGQLAFSVIDGGLSFTNRLKRPNAIQKTQRSFYERGSDSIPNSNVTFGVKRLIEAGVDQNYNFVANVGVGGKGELGLWLEFRFEDLTGEGYGEVTTQTPKDCMDIAINTTTIVSSGSSGGGGVDLGSDFGRLTSKTTYSKCRYDGYNPLETGTKGYTQEYLNYLGPMYPSDTANKTWKMGLENYRCDPLGGEDYCVVNPDTGDVDCYEWDELLEAPNSCAIYEEDSSCNEIKRECTDGWDVEMGEKNYCFNDTVTFRCDEGSSVEREIERRSNSCASAIPCVGGDCNNNDVESNDRFVEAAIQSNILQQVDGDMNCTDKADPTTCRIFEGEPEYCSWEVTGLGMDCCESPGGMDILAYVMTANLMLQTNKMAANGLFGATVKGASTGTSNTLIELKRGAGDTIRDGVSNGWNALPEAITTPFETLAGNVQGAIMDATGQTVAEGGASAATGAISSALSALQQEAFQLVYDMLPEELATALFTEKAGEKAGEEATKELVLNEAVSSALQSIMAAYSIYSTIKLALTLLTMCDENESDMGIKLGQRQCFKVDGDYCSKNVLGVCYQKRQNYCCYNSILARIIMEQTGPQLGKDLTNCEGLSQAELGEIDFDRIDLSEWVGLMIESGSIKDEAGEQNLTGGGTLVESRCEEYEVEDPYTGIVTIKQSCFKELEGGRRINAYGRENVSDRTLERISGADAYAEDARAKANAFSNDLDCSASPRPQVCQYGFDIRNNGGG